MSDCHLIQSLIAGVDHAARQAEDKWGVGMLADYVSVDTRARFTRQQQRWRAALEQAWNANPLPKAVEDALRAASGGMERAWVALDAEATANGHAPLSPTVWETTTKAGVVVAIVKTTAEAIAVTRDGRHKAVYSLDEIANVIDALGVIGDAKIVFPGAKVVRAPGERRDLSWVKDGDPLPF